MNSKVWTLPLSLLVIVISFGFVVKNHDPVAFLGWLFCLAVGVSADEGTHRESVTRGR